MSPLRSTYVALVVGLIGLGASAHAQTAAPAGRPGRTAQPMPAVRPMPGATKPTPPTAAAPATARSAAAPTAAKSEPVDINTASQADLRAVPGIGPVYAAKIIAGRPYRSKDELTRKKILPTAVYAKTSARLIARQH